MRATMIALLKKLLADNTLHSYSIDEESVPRTTRLVHRRHYR